MPDLDADADYEVDGDTPPPSGDAAQPTSSPFPITPGHGLLGGFEKLPSDGISERWLYTPIGGAAIPDDDGNPCAAWIVTRPIGKTVDTADHSFVVVADKPGATPQARFSYGPTPDWKHLISSAGTQDATDKSDKAAWENWNNPLYGVRMEPIPASDASVLAAGQSLSQYLGTPSHPGPVGYGAVPELWPKGSANSNSAASAVANRAIALNPSPLNQAYLEPYPGSLSPGWYKPIPGWKP